jgi:hypothetical protein
MRTPKQTKAWSVRNPILEKIQFSFRDSIIRATTPQEKLDNVKYIFFQRIMTRQNFLP